MVDGFYSLRQALDGVIPPGTAPDAESGQPPAAAPPCPDCLGMGWLRAARGVTVPCQACKAHRSVLPSSSVPDTVGRIPDALARAMTYQAFRPDGDAGQNSALRAVYHSMEMYGHIPVGWRVLSGGSGVGKTHLMAAAATTIRERCGGRVFWANTLDLLERLRMLYATEGAAAAGDLLQEARQSTLLALDDLGAERLSAFADEKLRYILQARYELPWRPTIITTSLSPEELGARYGWLASPLGNRSMVTILRIDAPDYRRTL